MIAGLFHAARFAQAAMIGTDALVEALARYGISLALKSRKVDDDAGDDMVEEMQGDAPQLSGRLVNGITTRREGDATVVEAEAINPSGRIEWNYAPFVEHGTAHNSAEPFFYDNAEQVLEGRGGSLEDAMGAAGTDAGF